MGFFFAEAKASEPKPAQRRTTKGRGVIPIDSLRQLGCSVCPRNDAKEVQERLHSKLRPTGDSRPTFYLMGTGPNLDEDESGEHWTGEAGSVILSKFSRGVRKNHLRFGHITQCMPPTEADGRRDLNVGVAETECCRNRVIEDIEETKPLVIIGVGDAPLAWATSLPAGKASALTFRGTLFAVNIGRHRCWYYPILWPNFITKKRQFGKSEYELALEHDIDKIERLVFDHQLQPPNVFTAPFDKGIEIITGAEPNDFQRLERALADLVSEPVIGIDIESTGLRPYVPDSFLVSAAVGTFDRTVAFSIDHPDGWGSKSRRTKVHQLFSEFVLYSGKKIAHNLAMEQEWLAYHYGDFILRRTEWGDSMAMAHTLDERPGIKSLEVQTVIKCGFNLKAQSSVDVGRPNWWTLYSLKEILRYNGMDTKWCFKIAELYLPELEADPVMLREYERKVRLAPTLVKTQLKGMPVDVDFAQKLSNDFRSLKKDIETKIQRLPDVKKYASMFGPFDPGNSHHVLKLMHDMLKRPEVMRENRDGSTSLTTDEDALNEMGDEVPAAKLILEHRGIDKQIGTYIEPVVERRIVYPDHRMHPSYSSMIAVTGRLAAQDPNAQNWPKRKFRIIRGIVTTEPNQWIVAADYGQIEFRVVGMASEDDNLVKYCWTGYDVHGFWAQRFVDEYPEIKDYIVREFEVDWDEKGLKTLRQEAKNGWVFPQLFGSSLASCARNLHIPLDVAEDLGAEFWDEFPGVKAWQNRLLQDYEKNLYVETLTGRQRRGPMTKNEIINHPVQGTAADIVLEGMNALSERSDLEEQDDIQPNLNVHDDLSNWVNDARVERVIDIMAHEMCLPRFDFINVPLVVEVSVGTRWNELEEIAKFRSDELFGTPNPYR